MGKRSSIWMDMNSRGMTGKWKHMWHSSPPCAEVGDGVLRPLVGLGEQDAIFVLAVEVAAQFLEESVRLRQVLAAGAVALVQVGNGVQPQAIDAALQPEIEDVEDGLVHGGVVVVEIGLVRVEAVPVKGVGDRVPGPVGQLEVLEDDAGFLEAIARVAPDVEVAFRSCPAANGGRAGTTDAGRRCG